MTMNKDMNESVNDPRRLFEPTPDVVLVWRCAVCKRAHETRVGPSWDVWLTLRCPDDLNTPAQARVNPVYLRFLLGDTALFFALANEGSSDNGKS